MSKNTINLSVRVNAELKHEAESLLADLGMNMTTAINLFLRQTVRNQGIPFSISIDEIPNRKTLAAMKEVQTLPKDPKAKSFFSVNELMEDLKE